MRFVDVRGGVFAFRPLLRLHALTLLVFLVHEWGLCMDLIWGYVHIAMTWAHQSQRHGRNGN